MTVLANSLLNLTRPQLPVRRSNTGNGRSRHGTNINYQSRYQEALQNGQQYYNSNAYPYYYNNGYSGRSNRGWGSIIPNGSHQRPPNRSRGASGSNGYIQQSQLHARPISQSQASSGATKYGVQNQTHHSYRPRSNGNSFLPGRGNGSRGIHYGGNGISRGRGRGDGKT